MKNLKGLVKNEKVEVSVIIVVYNQPKTLKLSLRALLSQDFKERFEIIICDNGSSAQLFFDFRNYFNEFDIPLKYIWQQYRGYQAAQARNNGIKIAKGRILIFLDGDIVPTLDFINQHVKAYTQPKLLVAGNRHRRTLNWSDAEINQFSINKILKSLKEQEILDPLLKERDQKEKKRRIEWLNSEHPWKACFSCNLSVEKSPEVYFDTNFIGWGFEDWEFAYRLCKINGYTPIYKSEIEAYHLETIISKPLILGTHEKIVQYLQNACYFYDKCAGLKLEEVFRWFPKFQLDSATNTWSIKPSQSDLSSYELRQVVSEVRKWLTKNHIYPKKNGHILIK